jgi:predicted transposase/invertase (TIGR01784 family)
MITARKSHIRFDWAAKKILRSKANFGILEGFLSELFQEDVKIKTLLSEEGNKETQDDKSNRVDILIENTKGELIIVEIQNTREIDYLFRVLFGTSKAITEYMKEGSPYSKVKKVITVSIVYFNFGQGKDYLYKGQTVFEGVNQHDIFELSDEQKTLFKKSTVSDIFPFHYLIRVNQFDDIAKNTIDEWIYFFKNSEIKNEFKAKGLGEAREKLKTLAMNPKQLAEYQRYLEVLSSNASIAETIQFELEYEKQKAEKALKQQKIEITNEITAQVAKEGILQGLTNELINTLTKLPLDEIDELRNQLNDNN